MRSKSNCSCWYSLQSLCCYKKIFLKKLSYSGFHKQVPVWVLCVPFVGFTTCFSTCIYACLHVQFCSDVFHFSFCFSYPTYTAHQSADSQPKSFLLLSSGQETIPHANVQKKRTDWKNMMFFIFKSIHYFLSLMINLFVNEWLKKVAL